MLLFVFCLVHNSPASRPQFPRCKLISRRGLRDRGPRWSHFRRTANAARSPPSRIRLNVTCRRGAGASGEVFLAGSAERAGAERLYGRVCARLPPRVCLSGEATATTTRADGHTRAKKPGAGNTSASFVSVDIGGHGSIAVLPLSPPLRGGGGEEAPPSDAPVPIERPGRQTGGRRRRGRRREEEIIEEKRGDTNTPPPTAILGAPGEHRHHHTAPLC